MTSTDSINDLAERFVVPQLDSCLIELWEHPVKPVSKPIVYWLIRHPLSLPRSSRGRRERARAIAAARDRALELKLVTQPCARTRWHPLVDA